MTVSTPLINCRGLTHRFTEDDLFTDLNISIHPYDRVGLIGANGNGKSTVLKAIAEIIELDSGQIVKKKNLKLGLVSQNPEFDLSKPIRECVLEYQQAQTGQLDELNADKYLSLAGFEDVTQIAKSLSGGWKKRLQIACTLSTEPEVVLFDEPTNHLDIQGIDWLESQLTGASYTWIVVSHDRFLLEKCAQKIIELDHKFENGHLLTEGNYTTHLQKKEEFLSQQSAYADTLSNKLRREKEWLSRGPKARSTKSKSRIDRAHQLDDHLKSVKSRMRTSTADIDFKSSGRKTKILIEVKDISMHFDQKKLFENCSFTIQSKNRIGVLGENGSGKSTLLKIIQRELEPTSGTIKQADSLKISYFDQERTSIDESLTLRQALCDSGDTVVFRGQSVHVTSWAKKFQFSTDQLNTPVAKLSGGEKARILIARFMLIEADIMLLDEPNNDLDIPTREILEDSFKDFEGAIVLITHDRFMLRKLCNRIIAIAPDGTCSYLSSYEQWLKTKSSKATSEREQRKNKSKTTPKKRKMSYKEKTEYETIEANVLKAETELKSWNKKLLDPTIASDPKKIKEASLQLEKHQTEIERLYERWAELEEIISS